MMTILCPDHKYLWRRLNLDQIIRYVAYIGCTNCHIDED